SALAHCARLQTLTLYGGWIDKNLIVILRDHCPHLTSLTLEAWQPLDDDIRTLATVSSLKHLDLYGEQGVTPNWRELTLELQTFWIGASDPGVYLSCLPPHVVALTIDEELVADYILSNSSLYPHCTSLTVYGDLVPNGRKWTSPRLRSLVHSFPHLQHLNVRCSPYVLYTVASTTGLPLSLQSITCRAPYKCEYTKTVQPPRLLSEH